MTADKASTDKKANINPAELPIPNELSVLPLNDFRITSYNVCYTKLLRGSWQREAEGD